jgi:hypothetical protein
MSQDLLPPAPLCRSRIAAAERELHEMTAVLTGDGADPDNAECYQ